MSQSYAIHWFRRDLRIAGNEALRYALNKTEGRVVGLFCFDEKFLARKDFSHDRFAFFLNTLVELKKELLQAGSDLLVVNALPQQVFPKLISDLEKQTGKKPKCISFNRDYEPFARKRDETVTQIIQEKGVEVQTERDHLIFEPCEILKDDQTYYKVYTPYGKRWMSTLHDPMFKVRLTRQKSAVKYLKQLSKGEIDKIFNLTWKGLFKTAVPYEDALDKFQEQNQKKVGVPIPKAGSLEAFRSLESFKSKLKDYKEARDFPAMEGTSRLSLFLKNGSITTSLILHYLGLEDIPFMASDGPGQFVKEIAWREFNYQILYHCPRVEHEAFLEKYKDLQWQNNKEWFEKWMEGMTGFPIVDAGMRQLKQTGWMHNRVRMIVASFLTKDLLIDWRWGERYFMEKLLDGDLAPNNGGWQWSASTGCDAQPYFRIFNPVSQSKRFDPQGDYIRRFVPELEGLNVKEIHEPHKYQPLIKYAKPLVEHDKQRTLALGFYKSVTS